MQCSQEQIEIILLRATGEEARIEQNRDAWLIKNFPTMESKRGNFGGLTLPPHPPGMSPWCWESQIDGAVLLRRGVSEMAS